MHCLQCIDNYGIHIRKAYKKGKNQDGNGKKEQIQSKDKV